MPEPIQVMIGLADEVNDMPMAFWIYDDGVEFGSEMTKEDLEIAQAVLLDLADAFQVKLNSMMN